MRRSVVAGFGGVTAAFLGSLCCAGPLLFVTLGVGAGLASTFEPLRPVFGAAMLGLFGFGFYLLYGRRRRSAAEPAASPADCRSHDGGASCALPRRRNRDALILWSAAGIALVLWTLPTWLYLFL